MKLIRKPYVVEAFEWDGNLENKKVPQWFTDAVLKFEIQFTDEYALLYTNDGGVEMFIEGDYIVRGENGDISILVKEEVAKNYILTPLK